MSTDSLTESPSSASDVIAPCDEGCPALRIGHIALLGIYEVQPNALCPSHFDFCVSGGRVRSPTIMPVQVFPQWPYKVRIA
jgi:hypothetical protein